MQHWSDHLEFLRDGATILKGKFGKGKVDSRRPRTA